MLNVIKPLPLAHLLDLDLADPQNRVDLLAGSLRQAREIIFNRLGLVGAFREVALRCGDL
ncbi:hypothetical protein ABZ863_11690 [Saccharomonospora sp. NPDC046836]|uniref:hypothetical protein n=1 Tax=Saccharomonospora sp. NPDC046836 TaxID=3156921 RepID=UPI0033DE2B2A